MPDVYILENCREVFLATSILSGPFSRFFGTSETHQPLSNNSALSVTIISISYNLRIILLYFGKTKLYSDKVIRKTVYRDSYVIVKIRLRSKRLVFEGIGGKGL